MSYASSTLAKLQTSVVPEGFVRNAGLIAGSAAVSYVIFFLVSPILTRIYSPEDFGILGVFASVLSITLPLVSWRYEIPITMPEDDAVAANVFAVAIIILLGMTSLGCVGFFLFGTPLMKGLHASSQWQFLCLLTGGMFAGGLFQVLNFWALRKRAFGQIARTKVAQGSMAVGTQLFLGLLHGGPLGLLLGDVFGRAAGIRILVKLVWKDREKFISGITAAGLIQAAERYKRFPIYSCSSGVLNAAGLNLPVIMMASLYGTQVAGFFSVALRLIGLPIMLLGQAAGQVFWGEASRMLDEPFKLSRMFYRTLRTMVLLGAAIVAPLMFFAPSALAVVFGEQWREAGFYVQLLSLGFLADFVATPLSSTLLALERQSWQLAWDAGRLVLVLIVFAAGYSFGVSAHGVALLYGIAQLMAYLGHLVLCATAISLETARNEHQEWSDQLL
jgi:O-antigen/teichoic acid export membrane protein